MGGGVWKRFTATFDYDALTMTLTPNPSYDAPDAWDRSGLFLINTGAITIIDVRAGTPAATAGLTKGETIQAINGAAVSTMTLRSIRDTLIGKPGDVVHLTVKSKDEHDAQRRPHPRRLRVTRCCVIPSVAQRSRGTGTCHCAAITQMATCETPLLRVYVALIRRNVLRWRYKRHRAALRTTLRRDRPELLHVQSPTAAPNPRF